MPASRKPAAQSQDAIALLMADHREVEALFAQYDELAGADDRDDEKMLLAAQICVALTVHTELEEALFYPAARAALKEGDQDVVDEAYVEHAGAKQLIAEIRDATPDAPMYDAKLKVLSEYIKHHVGEEEDELFPKLRRAALDLEGLGRELAERKQQLMADTGEPAQA
jgi:hemerythrin superfamily protein